MLFLNMLVLLSGNNSISSLDLIILILLLGRFVLIKETPGEHYLSHNSGKTYTASCTESWCELVNEYSLGPERGKVPPKAKLLFDGTEM